MSYVALTRTLESLELEYLLQERIDIQFCSQRWRTSGQFHKRGNDNFGILCHQECPLCRRSVLLPSATCHSTSPW